MSENPEEIFESHTESAEADPATVSKILNGRPEFYILRDEIENLILEVESDFEKIRKESKIVNDNFAAKGVDRASYSENRRAYLQKMIDILEEDIDLKNKAFERLKILEKEIHTDKEAVRVFGKKWLAYLSAVIDSLDSDKDKHQKFKDICMEELKELKK